MPYTEISWMPGMDAMLETFKLFSCGCLWYRKKNMITSKGASFFDGKSGGGQKPSLQINQFFI